MAEDARSLIRSAQQAELDGDLGQARFLLDLAAQTLEAAGNSARAEQLRRHRDRLAAPTEAPLPPAAPPQALELRDARPGPTPAARGVPAWCTFCCRPQSEVGPLAAAPSDAFICRACVQECSELLAIEAPKAGGNAPSARAEASEATQPLNSQAALRGLEARLQARRAFQVLLVGPSGAGKTHWLKAWANAGLGTYVRGASLDAGQLPEGALLIDDAEALAPSESEALCRETLPERSFVLGIRGALPAPRMALPRGAHAVPAYTTEELQAASGQRLSLPLLERVATVVGLPTMETEDLLRLGEGWLRGRGLKMEPDVLAELTERAGASGRSAHELYALLRRVYDAPIRSSAGDGA